jgi:hypothetical protein
MPWYIPGLVICLPFHSIDISTTTVPIVLASSSGTNWNATAAAVMGVTGIDQTNAANIATTTTPSFFAGRAVVVPLLDGVSGMQTEGRILDAEDCLHALAHQSVMLQGLTPITEITGTNCIFLRRNLSRPLIR